MTNPPLPASSVQPTDRPDLSVVICTRNRGISIVETIESLFRCDYPDFELLVIDQSTNDQTRKAIQPFLSDRRFCYIPLATKGKPIACNVGLQHANAEIVVYTDDDCVVTSDFLKVIGNLFKKDPQVALAFCSVAPGIHNGALGTIPSVQFQQDRTLDSFSPYHLMVIMGAGMAMRKTVVTQLGGFDTMIGPGTPFQSGDDLDLAMRVLSRRHRIYQISQALVTHYGFRTHEEYRATIAHNFYGLGSIHAKFIKILDIRILSFLLYNVLIKCVWQPLVASLRNRKFQGFRRGVFYMQGLAQGLRTPVDRKYLLYRVSDP